MEQVLRRENIRALTRGLCLPIGGELREEDIVVGIALRACQQIVKEGRGLLVVLPKYAEIIRHLYLLRQGEHLSIVADSL